MSYPPGWSLTARTSVRQERWPGGLESRCVPLVRVGEYVEPEQPVMRRMTNETGEPLAKIPRLSLPTSVSEGLPGAMGSREQSRSDTVIAGLRGEIIATTPRGSVIIDSLVATVGGAMGAGRQVAGPLTIWQPPAVPARDPYIPVGAILVVPGPVTALLLRQALNSGIVGVVASSIASTDFESFLHTNLLDLLNCTNVELGMSHLPRLTVLLTEGLGNSSMPARTMELLTKYQGMIALLEGATSPQAQKYPGLTISLPRERFQQSWRVAEPDTELRPGALVRVCSGNYQGATGEIDYLFTQQQLFPSGVRARAARIRLEDHSLLIVPLPALERIG